MGFSVHFAKCIHYIFDWLVFMHTNRSLQGQNARMREQKRKKSKVIHKQNERAHTHTHPHTRASETDMN